MGDSDRHAEARLPVSVELIASEIIFPARNAVKLREHTLSAELMHGGLRLLCGGEFKIGAEHIDAGNVKAAVRTHGFAQSRSLALKRRFLHHVPRQSYPVFAAPRAADIGKRLSKTLRNVVVIMITGQRNPSVRQLPKDFGQACKNVLAVLRLICFGQVVRPRHNYVALVVGIIKQLFAGELRFIGENRGDYLSEMLADGFLISLVSYLNKAFNGFRVEGVNIGLIVIPRRRSVDFDICIPFCAARGVIGRNYSVIFEITVFVKLNIVAANQAAFSVSAALCS